MNIHLRLSNYISRYAPSKQKVLAYLAKKGREDAEQLLQEIWYNEQILLQAWIKTFIAQSRGKQEMRQKLLLKGFLKDDIEKSLEDFQDEILDFSHTESFIKNFITSQLRKNKSLVIIREKLFLKFPYFKNEIISILKEYDDMSSLSYEVEKYKKKYNINNPQEKQKFYSALMRKGFTFPVVRDFFK